MAGAGWLRLRDLQARWISGCADADGFPRISRHRVPRGRRSLVPGPAEQSVEAEGATTARRTEVWWHPRRACESPGRSRRLFVGGELYLSQGAWLPRRPSARGQSPLRRAPHHSYGIAARSFTSIQSNSADRLATSRKYHTARPGAALPLRRRSRRRTWRHSSRWSGRALACFAQTRQPPVLSVSPGPAMALDFAGYRHGRRFTVAGTTLESHGVLGHRHPNREPSFLVLGSCRVVEAVD